MKQNKKSNEPNPKTVEGISQAIVFILGSVGLYYIAVFAEWIEPLF